MVLIPVDRDADTWCRGDDDLRWFRNYDTWSWGHNDSGGWRQRHTPFAEHFVQVDKFLLTRYWNRDGWEKKLFQEITFFTASIARSGEKCCCYCDDDSDLIEFACHV